jgi:hypothetical protein
MTKNKTAGKPGQIAPVSGQYGIQGPRGGKAGTEVTIVQGKPFPPTPKPNQTFVLVDKTVHKDDKAK